jgi:hypothetical protein
VAERVVHVLEVVEVEEHHGDLNAAALRLRDRLRHPVAEHGAVGQAGQHVVLRQVADALLVVLALRQQLRALGVGGIAAFELARQRIAHLVERVGHLVQLVAVLLRAAQPQRLAAQAVQAQAPRVRGHAGQVPRDMHVDEHEDEQRDEERLGRFGGQDDHGPLVEPPVHALEADLHVQGAEHAAAPGLVQVVGALHDAARARPAGAEAVASGPHFHVLHVAHLKQAGQHEPDLRLVVGPDAVAQRVERAALDAFQLVVDGLHVVAVVAMQLHGRGGERKQRAGDQDGREQPGRQATGTNPCKPAREGDGGRIQLQQYRRAHRHAVSA